MRNLGRAGLILSLIVPATMAAAAEPRAVPGAVPADTPVQPDARSGGWTPNGWSEGAPAAARGQAAAPDAKPPAASGPAPVVSRAIPAQAAAVPQATVASRAAPSATPVSPAVAPLPPTPPVYADAPRGRAPGRGVSRDDDNRAYPTRYDDPALRRQTWDGGRGAAFAYRRGSRLPDAFAAPDYVVADWDGYGFPPPGPGRDWVRYYGDAVLVDRRGYVLDARTGVDWDNAARAPRLAYGNGVTRWDDRDAGFAGYQSGYPGGAAGQPQVYTTPGGGTTVTITTQPSIGTTTVTTTDTYLPARPRTARRR